MDLSKELAKNQTILFFMPGLDYNKTIVDIAKKLGKKNVCYITLNRTCDSLTELFTKNKIKVDNFIIIDAITNSIKDIAKNKGRCYFLNPGSLTELALTIAAILEQQFDYLIFDSLTNLFTYNQADEVEKFIIDLINKIRPTKVRALLYALNEEKGPIEKCALYVDKTLVLGKN